MIVRTSCLSYWEATSTRAFSEASSGLSFYLRMEVASQKRQGVSLRAF